MKIPINDFESIFELKVGESIELKTNNIMSAKCTVSKVKRMTGGYYKVQQLENDTIIVSRETNKEKTISWTKKMRMMLVGSCLEVVFEDKSEIRKVRATASNLKHYGVHVVVENNKLNCKITREL